MLYVDGPQPLAHYNHLTNFIREKAHNSVEIHSSTIEKLYKKSVSQYKYEFDKDSPAIFTKSSLVANDSSLVREQCQRRRRITVEKLNTKIDTIYISSQVSLPTNDDLHSKVLGGLASLGYEVIGFTAYSKDDVLGRDFDFDAGSASGAKMVFAIVDDDSMGDEETQKVVRKLHRWADCDQGALLICVTKSHLMERYSGKNDPYLPSSLRHKINYLLGRPNFDVSGMKEALQLRKGSLMIAGGHTAHHSDDKTYLPSITAVVASTSWDPSKFLGSCRFHDTVNPKQRDGKLGGRTDRIKRLVTPAFEELEDMMKGRFEACEIRPSRLLFYFDGSPVDDPAHGTYCRSIDSVYASVFPDAPSLRLTYIAVNKNEYLKYDEPVPVAESETTPISAFVTEASSMAKHRHYVIRNDEQWSTQALITVTRALNSSCQLASPTQPVSGSLPTMLAGKLCKRVHNYICDDMKPHEITRNQRGIEWDYMPEFEGESKAVEEAIGLFRHEQDPDRLLPWKKELDETIFFL